MLHSADDCEVVVELIFLFFWDEIKERGYFLSFYHVQGCFIVFYNETYISLSQSFCWLSLRDVCSDLALSHIRFTAQFDFIVSDRYSFELVLGCLDVETCTKISASRRPIHAVCIRGKIN